MKIVEKTIWSQLMSQELTLRVEMNWRAKKILWRRFRRLVAILDKLNKEHPIWLVEDGLTYNGPSHFDGHRWAIYFRLAGCTLVLEVAAYEDAKVSMTLWSFFRQISIGDYDTQRIEKDLRTALEKIRLQYHVRETWSR